jgi:hypothetical protein
MIRYSLLTSFPTPERRKRGKNRREREKKRKIVEITGSRTCCLPFLPDPWQSRNGPPSTILPGHLQKQVKHGFMTVAEIEACCVLEDPMFPAPMEGYVASFMAFYERGFCTPVH